jgi:hypothetical protein
MWLMQRRGYHVDYAAAERLCGGLAASLLARFGRAELHTFAYAAIPRGGFIVLGMLAYLLDLPADRLLAQDDAPVMLVDDCALSGLRFVTQQQRFTGRPMVFAHLLSTPALRAALLTSYPELLAVIAARDLQDMTAHLWPDPDAREAWAERWAARRGERPWNGITEHVTFAWSEPDAPVWNPVTGQAETLWRTAAPDRCLRNWSGLHMAPVGHGVRAWRSPDHVVYAVEDERVLLVDRRTEMVYALEGTAALLWRALAAYGDPDVIVAQLAGRYPAPPLQLRRDLADLIADLQTLDLVDAVAPAETMDTIRSD